MKRSFSIIVIFIALAILGCALIPRLPVKLMPSRMLPQISVGFSMPSASARVVESQVTSRLESMLARVQGVNGINSTSWNGGGSIDLTLDNHTDIGQARFEASPIIRQMWSELPDEVSYPHLTVSRTISQSAMPVLTYTINAPGKSSEIMRYADENIRTQLAKTVGVNHVQINGATPMEWHLTYDSEQLKELGITPDNIAGAISEQMQSTFIGMALTDAGQWLSVRTTTGDADLNDLSKILVSVPGKEPVRLDAIVTFRHTEAEPSGYHRINGMNSIFCDIYADEDANQIEVVKAVKERLASMQLPNGYVMRLANDVTESISSELEKIYIRTGLTLIILLAFVALITRSIRYMAVISISLLLSLAVAVIFYYFFNIEIQLYSLAGITISLNLIIDNIIVMSDHYHRHRNVSAFPAVLAATLTTIGALGIVFFLDDSLRLNLQDFVAVVIINLSVSLAASLWLVPALIQYTGLDRSVSRKNRSSLRMLHRFNACYMAFINFALRYRWLLIAMIVLCFGLPTFMLPDKIDGCEAYNKTLGSKMYIENIRPVVDRILGGTLRIFVQDVFSGSYFSRGKNEPVLEITSYMPNGATLEQMNELIKKMEAYLADIPEIRQFRTEVRSAQSASISVFFTKKAARSTFPIILKTDVIRKAPTLGGGSWTVRGIDDNAFNNSITERSGSYKVKLMGYNYDELEKLAEEFRTILLSHQRIKEVEVSSDFSWYKDDYSEYYLEIDKQALARMGLNVSELFGAIRPVFGRDMRCGTTPEDKEAIFLMSRQAHEYDVWALMNRPFEINNKSFKLSEMAKIAKSSTPQKVAKENQQYRLCLQYDYIGSLIQGDKLLKNDIKEFRERLPLGYSIETPRDSYHWGDKSNSSYKLLLLVIAIIFFTTAILFNSLILPFAIILTIPISFIGVFTIFYLTHTNFDQGGFASFVLLCGITVNAAIYLINEFNRHKQNTLKDYVKTFNAKIFPITLTVLSTVLGFIPFMIAIDGKEGFWFSLAIGTIGGLVMSLIALIVFVPIFIFWNRRPC